MPQRPPARKRGAAKGGGGKKGKGKSGGNTGLIIGGAVGAVVLLFGLVGGLFAAGVFSGAKPDPNQITVGPGGNGVFAGLLKEQGPTPIPPRGPVPEAAKWLPAETELVIHIRVADLLKSPLISELIKTNLLEDQVKAGFAAVGLTPDDLESVTVGVGGLDKAAQQMQRTQAAMIMGGMPPMTMDVPSVAVFQLKTPLTYDAITKAAQGQTVTKAQHAGKEFLEASAPNVPTKPASIWRRTKFC